MMVGVAVAMVMVGGGGVCDSLVGDGWARWIPLTVVLSVEDNIQLNCY